MSAVIETGDAPLDPEQLAQLRSAAAGKTRAERGRLIPGVGREGMAQALAGLPVRPATRALIRLGLERLANIERDVARLEHYQAHPQIPCRFLDHDALGESEPRPEEHDPGCPWVAARTKDDPIARALEDVLDEMTSKALPKPVCPRCLGLTPGTPAGGTPETHPGPFTEGLCAACSRAVERDLRKEGRIQAADFEAKRPEKAAKQRSVEKLNQERRAAWESMTRRQIALYGGTLEQRGDTYVVKAPPETAPILVALMRITNPNVLVEVS